MTDFEQPRKMIISVAGGFNNLLLEPPLPDEVFAELVEPRVIGADTRVPYKVKQYGASYTCLAYKQVTEALSTLPPGAYGQYICEYLGRVGIQVEFDEFIYESSPETLLMMATEPPPPETVQVHGRML